MVGELVIDPLAGLVESRGAEMARFGLALSGVEGRQGPTGTITVLGDSGRGTIRPDGRQFALSLDIAGRLNNEALDRALSRPADTGCYRLPAFVPCSTRVELILTGSREEPVATRLRLTTICDAGEYGEVLTITAELDDVEIAWIAPVGGSVNNVSNSPYDPCDQVNRRTLSCRPVIFQSSASDPTPTGGTIAAQFATAQAVWEKCCITIDVLPTHVVTDATLKTSSNETALRASYTDSNPDVIEVYFVANPLTAIGGGSAGAIGVASCKVLMAEPNNGNPVLLAHELGHVLGLLHPSGTGSQPGTVMQPTGSAMNPGTDKALHAMCQAIANPVLATSMTPCCRSHDIPDHYIRDFPVDAGQEPSDPLPSGMTRYSMSNVWNRRTNTPGTWSAMTGPAHESPYRFQNDGVTPATNYFFAKVELLNNFQVTGAQVKFYVKAPGSGGGAAITLIGAVSVPGGASGLAVGSPQTVSLPWNVPATVVGHSCCFAVVTSPAEPEGTPMTLSWSQFEDMCRQDNDWAQRNLDIIEVSPDNSAGNVYESAPWQIVVPKSADIRKAPLTLRASALGECLQAAELEVAGAGVFKLEPGKTVTIRTGRTLAPGEECAVTLRAKLPARPARGAEVSVLIDPVVGDRELVGFGTTFRVAGDRLAKRMFLDRLIAAAWDVADATDEAPWHQLAFDLRAFADDRVPHLRELARRLVALKSLQDCVASAECWPTAGTYGLAAAGKRLLGAVKKKDVETVNASLWSFLTRTHMAVPTHASVHGPATGY